MSKFYFINSEGVQIGPIEKDVMLKVGITKDTLVWREGAPNWVAAEKEPELAEFFAAKATPYGSPVPPVAPPSLQYTSQSRPFSDKPSSYMWLSICSTLLCCLPLGIVSIVYASKVDPNWAKGDYDEALANSQNAKNWGLASVIAGFAVGLIFFIIGLTS